MNDSDHAIGQLSERKSMLRNALEAIDSLQTRLDSIERDRHEPIAIVGLSCRFPGAPSTEAYWELLQEGRNAVKEVPEDRWDKQAFFDPDPAAPGKMHAPYGGFLDGIELFDAAFFGISGREAETMDPQQRLLLETTWEALENAGIQADRLRGTQGGVFVGITASDYGRLAVARDVSSLDVYTATGGALNVAAGRIAYTLGLNGPAAAIDSACSSSLVAVHLACQSLRTRECSFALAAGVNVLLSPEPFVCFAKWGMMAPDGRCKTFDEMADGFVRAEGCGVIVLKRLSDAQAAGDRVLALIRGTAVNQDGASSGLTVPNGLAQQAVIRTALKSAGVQPGELDYIEAHGTGTTLGDPIELEAIAAVLGRNRPEGRPLQVGSVKTNIGHTESASGIAGLIKVVLAMQHEVIPRHINFQKLSSRISLGDAQIEIPVQAFPWPQSARARLAGVSSFGFSGTNAHVILQEAPPPPATAAAVSAPDRPAHLLVLSAKSETALQNLAATYVRRLADLPSGGLPDLCHSAAVGRSALSHRLAILATDLPAAVKLLQSAVDGAAHPGLITGHSRTGSKVAFLFTGQGSQFAGMGRSLYATEPVFREAFDRCAQVLDADLAQPLRVMLGYEAGRAAPNPGWLDETRCAEPALFAFEYALASLWRSWGIEPAAVVGHGLGEFVAACVAGVLASDDALRLVALRARMPGHLATLAGTITHRPPDIDFVLNDTGALLDDSSALDGSYWSRPTRETASFARSIRTLRDRGVTTFLEIGPAPVLIGLARQTVTDPDVLWLSSISKGADEWTEILSSLGSLYVSGCNPDWRALDLPHPRRRIDLPLYPFRRKRHWLADAPPAAAVAPERRDEPGMHPLLGPRIASPLKETVFACPLDPARQPVLREHRVAGLIVFPAAGFIELGLTAAAQVFASKAVRVEQGWLRAALVLDEKFPADVQLVVTPAETGAANFEVFSRARGADVTSAWTSHAGGRIVHGPRVAPALEPADAVRQRCTRRVDVAAYQQQMTSVGLDYGPSYRALVAASCAGDEAFGELRLPASDALAPRLSAHPGLLDATFHLIGLALGERAGDHFYLPVGFEAAEVFTPLGAEASAHVRLRVIESTRVVADVQVWRADRTPAVRVSGLQVRPITREQFRQVLGVERPSDLLHLAWRPAPATIAVAQAAGNWQIIGGTEALATGIAQHLGSLGARAELVAAAGANLRLARTPAPGDDAPGDIIDLRGLDIPDLDAIPLETAPSGTIADGVVGEILGLIRTLAAAPAGAKRRRLLLPTLRAQAAAPADRVNPLAATLWGIAATAAAELPALEVCMLDLDDVGTAAVAVAEAAVRTDAEARLAVRARLVLAARLVAADTDGTNALTLPPGAHELFMRDRGTLAGLGVRTINRTAPGPGQVEIEVLASGLNFRDVLNLLNMYPGPAGPLGNECCGRIVAVGEGVTGLATGDLVTCIAESTFATHVLANAALAWLVPAGLSLAQAAVFPISQLTAYLALHRIGRIAAGQRVLVHAGAGGVGLAAVHLALAGGAVVLATAGSDEKRRYLRGLGVSHVFDSRQTLTAAAVRQATDGHGVDLLLNSLTGDFIDEGLRALAPGGRFLEIGLRELRTPEQVAQVCSDVTYHALLLGDLCRSDPAFVRAMYDELVALLAQGRIPAPRVATFALDLAETAFTHMAKARHIGRVAILQRASGQSRVRGDGSYLVTGGLGALGLHMAEWLAETGARHVVLLGRNAPSGAATQKITALRSQGVTVEVVAGDVARAGDLAFLADSNRPPLRGVIHSAGIVDDSILARTDAARLGRVLRPKADGAVNLVRATARTDLDFFVLFSSASAVMGSPGQAAYAGANAFLDGFAARLRASGQTAVSINWGAWADGGMAARVDERTAREWTARGIGTLSVAAARRALTGALISGRAQVVALTVDWTKFLKALPAGTPPFLSELAPVTVPAAATPAPGATPAVSVRDWLLELPASERLPALTTRLRVEAAAVLGIADADDLDPKAGLTEQGMDSLMAVEFANRLGRAFGVSLPATFVFDFPTLSAVGKHLLAVLAPPSPAAPTAPPLATAPSGGRDVHGMNEADLAAELRRELDQAGF